MKLYEIDSEILSCIDQETGEICDIERFNELQMERENKIENMALWHKNLLAEATAYKAEKDAFGQKEKSAKNKADSLKKYLDAILQGGTFKTTRVNISYRKSESVEITDIDKIDKDYLKYVEPAADKTLIKNAIKQGLDIEGAELIEKQNIQIK